MNNDSGLQLNLKSVRARKARLGAKIGPQGEAFLWLLTVILGGAGSYGLMRDQGSLRHISFFGLALAGMAAMTAAWQRFDLGRLATDETMPLQLDGVLDQHLLARLHEESVNPAIIWGTVAQARDWHAGFVLHHLLLSDQVVAERLSNDPAEMPAVWTQAMRLRSSLAAPTIDGGIVTAALLLATKSLKPELDARRLHDTDVIEVVGWLERGLASAARAPVFFGGIGRDWSSGFTPILERFSTPISKHVEAAGGGPEFAAHADLADSIAGNLAHDMAVALIGPAGSGKSTLVDVVAERLLSSSAARLRYYQVVKLNAAAMLSVAKNNLEDLLLRVLGEAVNAGNIVLFLDDAQMFFGKGVGAFDAGQLLTPILQNRRLKLIAAFTPDDWQLLKSRDPALAASMAAVVIPEPTPADILKVVEGAANNLEHRHKILVSYDAVRESIRLSGLYMQEDAYPGKAVSLLEQTIPYADHGLVSAKTVQQALEKMRGVRAGASEAPEANTLLHLEELIHQRMINQTRAVNVVAAALRRGRAGVASPNRPVGSFLFLGPTGVGKTELARSLAAVYFGSERQMIRLDMSEYQSPEDVRRLIGAGGEQERSLLLQIRQQPFAVVLLDEIEKAHPNILNLLLQLLDEGQLTDERGRPASFRSAIIIATSNAGAVDIANKVTAGESLDDFAQPLIDKLIANGQFKPELINRFDEVVLFRPLDQTELMQVANLMLAGVNKTLAPQNIQVVLTPAALALIVQAGYQPAFGARPMRHVIQKTVENAVAMRILQGTAVAGSTITLDAPDIQQHLQQ